MRLRNLDLIVTMVIVAMNIGWALLPWHIPVIGIILALLLVFVLPGYMLTELVFQKRSLDVSHRLIFSLGLSLAIDILGGLILNLLPAGLHEISWAVLLGLLTVVFSLLVAYLRRGAAMNGARPLRFRFSIYGFILFGLATVIAVLSILYAALGAIQQPHTGFTQLWMLPAGQVGKSCAVHLGVRSFETTSVTYRITMTLNGAQKNPWSSITLDTQQEWERLVPISPGGTSNVYVEAQLYRSDKPEAAYRKVHVTLHSCTLSPTSSFPYPSVASAYTGTIHDIPANLTTNMSLTEIQQIQGNLTGNFSEATEPQGKGSFRGAVTATKQIHFTVTNDTGHIILSFDGTVQSDGTISGSCCSLDQKGRCSSGSGYGLWSAAPASS